MNIAIILLIVGGIVLAKYRQRQRAAEAARQRAAEAAQLALRRRFPRCAADIYFLKD